MPVLAVILISILVIVLLISLTIRFGAMHYVPAIFWIAALLILGWLAAGNQKRRK